MCREDNEGTPAQESTYTAIWSAEYPDGFITGCKYTPNDLVLDGDVVSGTFGEPEIFNCRVQDENGDAAFPLTEGTLDAGDVYNNPYFYPTDPDDWDKPWMVFWPKVFYSAETVDVEGTYIGLGIYEWNRSTGILTFLRYEEGVVFNSNTEYGANVAGNDISCIGVIWDNVGQQIRFNMHYNGAGIPLSTGRYIAQFGTLGVDITDDSPDINEREAISRGFDAVIGLNYASTAQLLRPQRGSNQGPDLAKTRRVDQVGMILHRTGPFLLGTDPTNTEFMDPKTPTEEVLATGQRPLYTGVFHDRVADKYSYDGQISWTMDRPGPGAFLAVGGFRNTQDR
jgi:hypothetical protein